ncbi:DUF917 domain-containing protein [Mycolicibacterium cosmeticum]|uniref:DUF917 domain-containing protein n=1 Tax=Mycolicibacterium cosmeticum TaxID=258533 RepID=W9BL23_MYCCO|nr:DUF917 domain-containing protein [Mycolicibacterium cosmeticum]TLH73246.1 DUF917 domain-containing protein [Mycolicibacterium cosmeticum]CDO08900.1 hypothetical protein BN977_03720 [Mycolicibacterium cosmeticum]
MWHLRRDDLDTLATGAALLGSGGGGQPYWFRALAAHAFGEREELPVHDIDDLPADALAIATGLVGSLLSFHERSPQGAEFTRAVDRVRREFADVPACVTNYESAGANIFAALVVAAAGALPLVDCDGMGRALSWLDQTTYDVDGVSIAPFVCTDSYGRTVLYEDVRGRTAEEFIRAAAVSMGGWCAFAGYPATLERLRTAGIPGTLRRALALGRTVDDAESRVVVDALIDQHGARRVATGRVADARWRRISDGGIGSVVIRGSGDAAVVRVEARNEFLIVVVDGEIVASTPEIICLMRTRDGRPLQAETVLATGTEVDVVALPAPPRWREPRFHHKVTPAAFGVIGV